MLRCRKAGKLGCWEGGKPSSLQAFWHSGILAAKIFFISFFLFHFSFFTPLFAFERTNVPLKNWGGFAVNRSWVYDALEKIVLAGMADQVLLNTKPLSRVEAARIVAQAVRKIQWDQVGNYNHRGYLQDILYQLVEEFGSELSEMGVKTPLNREPAPEFFHFKPIIHAQFGIDFASNSQRTVNRFGRSLAKGVNPSSTLDGSLQIGDFLSFYYQPVFYRDEDSNNGHLLNGYGKLTLWNTELLVGRESIWWGPGYRGSMSFSSNAFPLDQVRLSSAEPFRLPWFLKYLGPMKIAAFIAQLDKGRDVSRAKVTGWRFDLAPLSFLELGLSRVFQFDGEGRGSLNPLEYFEVLIGSGSDDPDSPKNVNNVMAVDFTLRFPDVDRYLLITRDLTFYGEVGWDDTKSGILDPDKPGGIVGFLFSGFLGDPKLDFRFEYAQTSDIQFTHFPIYTSGFTNRGSVLSHFIGTEGWEIFTRTSRWINKDLLLAFQISLAEIGPTDNSLLGSPREERNSIGIDLSYRFSDRSSIFLGYDFARVKNRDFQAGRSGTDNFFRVEFTRSFGK